MGLKALLALPVALLAVLPLTVADMATGEEKARELAARSKDTAVVDMMTVDYNRFLLPPKDYYVVAMFNALRPQRKCLLCKKAQSEFVNVAKAYQRSKQSGVFFVTFDYDSAGKVFTRHEIDTVPVIWVFPPTGRPGRLDKFNDLYRREPSAASIAKFVGDRTGQHFDVRPPVPWASRIAGVGVAVAAIYAVVTFFPTALFFRFANPVLCLASMYITLLFTSGHMWNQIRGAAMYTRDHNGRSAVFSGSGGQTKSETMSIMMLNTVAALGLIVCIEAQYHKIRHVPKDLIGVAAFILAFVAMALLLYVYRTFKNSSYPFKLLL